MDVSTVCRTRGPAGGGSDLLLRPPKPFRGPPSPSLCTTCRIFSHPRSRHGASDALGPLKPPREDDVSQRLDAVDLPAVEVRVQSSASRHLLLLLLLPGRLGRHSAPRVAFVLCLHLILHTHTHKSSSRINT